MEEHLAVVISRSCFLHRMPGECPDRNVSEIVDEIFSGWAFRIFPETAAGGWVKAETHYGFGGYIPERCMRTISRGELLRRQDRKKFRAVSVREADLLAEPRVQGPLLELLEKNALVELAEEKEKEGDRPETEKNGGSASWPEPENPSGEKRENGWTRVRTAAGRKGYVHTAFLRERREDDAYLLADKAERKNYFRKFARVRDEQEEAFREGLVQSAKAYLGTQYRWGGKSPQGVDCSGLVFLCYMENGALIYRDAGMPENYAVQRISARELKKGDLIFFPGHVAMYLGDGRYIHSTAYDKTPWVTTGSLNPEDTDYREDLAGKITGYGSIFAAVHTNAI